MKTSDKALKSYLYENRVSPTPEFCAGIDAVCSQIRQSEMREQRKAKTQRSTGKMPPKRRVLVIGFKGGKLAGKLAREHVINYGRKHRAA